MSRPVQVPVTPTPSQALYANISILEHSCINNASKHFDGDNRVVIRAAVNIKKGEHISINYSDPMWGSANRQLHLGKAVASIRKHQQKSGLVQKKGGHETFKVLLWMFFLPDDP